MLVRRSDVSAFFSIHRESCATGAYAMSASLAGSPSTRPVERSLRAGGLLAALRTKTSRDHSTRSITRSLRADGLQRVAGATFASRETFRGPTRRSTSGAIVRCQLAAAIWRSLALIVTCARRSASAKVDGETGGPVT